LLGVNDRVSSSKDGSVICLAPVFFVFIKLRAASDQFVSLEIWQGTLALETMGGNAVLLIDGPVSEVFTWLNDDSASVYSLYARADVG